MNVSGASLYGVPVINIGHTAKLAWSHTVSTAFRFVPYQLQLDPGDPTRYMVGGESVPMDRDQVTVQVRQPDGTIAPVTRTLYSTRYGPITTSIRGQNVFGWTDSTAFALWDANAENYGRLLNHFYETNLAQSTDELLEILQKYGGPVGEHDRRRQQGADALRRHRLDPQRPQLQGDRLLERLRPGDAADARPADARRLAPGVRARAGAGRALAGDLRQLVAAAAAARDYVANSNDSYWLTNPEQPLEGFPRIVGDERRSARCGPASA